LEFLLSPALDVGICGGGVPCTARYLAIFGFVSIPVMAGSVFLLVTALVATLVPGRSAAAPDRTPATSPSG